MLFFRSIPAVAALAFATLASAVPFEAHAASKAKVVGRQGTPTEDFLADYADTVNAANTTLRGLGQTILFHCCTSKLNNFTDEALGNTPVDPNQVNYYLNDWNDELNYLINELNSLGDNSVTLDSDSVTTFAGDLFEIIQVRLFECL
jgi:hypothetical protein